MNILPDLLPKKHMLVVLFVGFAGAGKTTYLERLKYDEFSDDYRRTEGIKEWYFLRNTERGPVEYYIVDVAADRTEHAIEEIFCDIVVVWFDPSTPSLLSKLGPLLERIAKQQPQAVPIVCANFADIRHKKRDEVVSALLERRIYQHIYPNILCIELSVKQNINVETLLLCMARMVVGDNHVRFVYDQVRIFFSPVHNLKESKKNFYLQSRTQLTAMARMERDRTIFDRELKELTGNIWETKTKVGSLSEKIAKSLSNDGK
jgi:GTPase SAR1 family protein